MTGYSRGELEEALRSLSSMLSKSEKALATMGKGAVSQRTLLERRIRALRIAEALVIRELDSLEP
ncbi:MAG: hypothetical protein FWD59_08360 [Micrococcales bacterium]|nr:hypothetical protein [Micrococcales bacterium]